MAMVLVEHISKTLPTTYSQLIGTTSLSGKNE